MKTKIKIGFILIVAILFIAIGISEYHKFQEKRDYSTCLAWCKYSFPEHMTKSYWRCLDACVISPRFFKHLD